MKHFLLSFILVIVTSCAYNKVLKGDDYEKKFVKAGEYFEKRKYNEAIALYEQVYQRFPNDTKGEVAYYRVGKAYFNLKDYYLGGYYLNSFSGKFPGSEKCEETSFMSALCAARNTPDTYLDQQETETALNELQMFTAKYPSSLLIDSCNKIMDDLRGRLEQKELNGILLYDKTENFNAATVSAESFLKARPLSKSRERVYEILIRNSFTFANNSVTEKKKDRLDATQKRIRKFTSEFPSSKYLSEIQQYDQKINVELVLLNK